MKCRICDSENLEQIFENTASPKTSHKYLTETELQNDKKVVVRVLRCGKCNMVQLADAYADDEYVSDYQRNISFSKSALAHMAAMAGDLASYRVKNVVEIGCGNGTFSKMLKEALHDQVAITAFEPSKAAYNAAKERGIDAHNFFFESSVDQKFSGYDGFALRFVLEHLNSPNEILTEIKKRCVPGAVGLVEIPNAQKQFAENRWFDYFPEHILYFTPLTVAFAFERLGFEVLSVKTTMQDEFLAVLVRVPNSKPWQEPVDIQKEFFKLVEGSTYVWGASGGAVTLLSLLFADKEASKNITAIVDSDVNKWGLFASGSGLKIVGPEEVVKNPPDTIIILAVSYETEIREQLKAMGYKGKVKSLRDVA